MHSKDEGIVPAAVIVIDEKPLHIFLSSANTSPVSLSIHLHPSRSLYQVCSKGGVICGTRFASATGASSDLVDRVFERRRLGFIAALVALWEVFPIPPVACAGFGRLVKLDPDRRGLEIACSVSRESSTGR